MSLENDPLYDKVAEQRDWFRNEAKKHKRLNRWLWLASTVISVLIALGTSFVVTVGPATTAQVAAGLAIVLPAVTAYAVLRSPEQLWILETSMRNRLSDLLTRMELEHHDNRTFDRTEIRREFLALMKEADTGWSEIKKGSGARRFDSALEP